MSRVDEILNFNKKFVENKEYTNFQTSRLPDKKIVVLTCMDTRLTELLPRAMNLRNGDAKFIKNAGATVMHPFGSVMRSIVLAIYALNAEEIFVIGHKDCGMESLKAASIIEKMQLRGIDPKTLETLQSAGIDLNHWLHGFDNLEQSVLNTVHTIVNHPLIPPAIGVHGLIVDPQTGFLSWAKLHH